MSLTARGYADVFSSTHDTQATAHDGQELTENTVHTVTVTEMDEPGPVRFVMLGAEAGPVVELFAYPDLTAGPEGTDAAGYFRNRIGS
ncbi:MAG: hypothetical protein AAGI30_02585 [Planctomycetota bacterium]